MEAISKTSKIDRIIKLTLLTIVGSILITISAKIKIPFSGELANTGRPNIPSSK